MTSPAITSDRDYRRLIDLIRAESGIEFPPTKRVMIETRLGKRARALGLSSLAAYCEYLHAGEKGREEILELIDAVTTHKTDFFREPGHFTYLTRQALPELARLCGAGIRQPLNVWSGASSTGEEPYTIAMVLAEHTKSVEPQKFRFRIEATDISTLVLETAALGIYRSALADAIPKALRPKYLMRSKDREMGRIRIVPWLRATVRFRQLNLLDADYGFREALDVVFCRNVMIYFDRSAQPRILRRIIRTLRYGGYLIMGHAESLNGMDLPLEQAAPTVYRRADA